MTELLQKYDAWLLDAGPAALVFREHLIPVEGSEGVLFPPTFAASEDKSFKGGYNIDTFPDGTNVCLINSVGSQANRMEPIFAQKAYAGLVPQIIVKAGERRVNLLEAGHRAGDALVRCSVLQDELRSAFKAVQKGNAEPLAKIAPTSLVFGAWDSRDTRQSFRGSLPRRYGHSMCKSSPDPLSTYRQPTTLTKDCWTSRPTRRRRMPTPRGASYTSRLRARRVVSSQEAASVAKRRSISRRCATCRGRRRREDA